MKKMFWVRHIKDPESKADTVWKNIEETKIDQQEIEDRFCDAKAAAKKADPGLSLAENVIKVTGPVKK